MNHKSVKRALGLTAAVVSTIGTMTLVPTVANAATPAHPAYVQPWSKPWPPWPDDLNGFWKPSGPGPEWNLRNGKWPFTYLHCLWRGGKGHGELVGRCLGPSDNNPVKAEGNDEYKGGFEVTEPLPDGRITHVFGEIVFDIHSPKRLTVHITVNNIDGRSVEPPRKLPDFTLTKI